MGKRKLFTISYFYVQIIEQISHVGIVK